MAKRTNNPKPRKRRRPEKHETVSDKPLSLPFLVAQLVQRGDAIGPTEAVLLEMGVGLFNGTLRLGEAIAAEEDLRRITEAMALFTQCSHAAQAIFRHLKL